MTNATAIRTTIGDLLDRNIFEDLDLSQAEISRKSKISSAMKEALKITSKTNSVFIAANSSIKFISSEAGFDLEEFRESLESFSKDDQIKIISKLAAIYG